MNIILSIIIPVYNCANVINRCLNSVLSQVTDQIEVIIVNDGSTDTSYEIVKKLVDSDSRIKLFDKKNGGVSSARNIGLDNCNGEYVIFVDSDDYIEEKTISSYLNLINQNDFDIIVTAPIIKNTTIFMEVSNDQNLSFEDFCNFCVKSKQSIFLTNSIWNKIYKKTIIQTRFDESIKLGEDLLFNIETFMVSSKILIINKGFYHYEPGLEGLSTSTKIDDLSKYLKVFKECCTLTKMHFPNEFHLKQIAFFEISICNFIIKYAKECTKYSDFKTNLRKQEMGCVYFDIKSMKYVKKYKHKLTILFLKYKIYYLIYFSTRKINN